MRGFCRLSLSIGQVPWMKLLVKLSLSLRIYRNRRSWVPPRTTFLMPYLSGISNLFLNLIVILLTLSIYYQLVVHVNHQLFKLLLFLETRGNPRSLYIRFAYRGALRYHKMTHPGDKANYCPQCTKSFVNPSTLKTHMRIHTGEKPHNCPQCSKSFSLSTDLVRHLKVHTGEKHHYCDKCAYSFARLDDLKRHLRVNSGEKLFSCSLCSKSYSDPTGLKYHLQVEHGDESPSYSCSQCPKSFKHSYNLKRHLKVHTREKT